MVVLLVLIAALLFGILSVLPGGKEWLGDVLFFLVRVVLPILAVIYAVPYLAAAAVLVWDWCDGNLVLFAYVVILGGGIIVLVCNIIGGFYRTIRRGR